MKSSIRWDVVHQRLRASQESLEQVLSESPRRIAESYRRRAIQLAHEQLPKQSAIRVPALMIRVARERYAVRLRDLAEVLPFLGCTELPGSAPPWRGLINLRGEIRPLIDLALMLSATPGNQAGYVLILRHGAALKVDDIDQLGDIPPLETPGSTHGNLTIALPQAGVAVIDVEAVLAAVSARKES